MYVPQDIIRNPEYSGMDVGVWCYCAIEGYAPWKDFTLVSAAQLVYQMFRTLDKAQSMHDGVKQSIRNLLAGGALQGKRVGKAYYEISKDSFDNSRWEHFVKVEERDIRTIFQSHMRPFAVLRHYLLLLSTINPKTKCGTWKNETLAATIGQDPEAITRYNKAVEQMQLLYIYRGLYSSNTYGRYEDKDIIIAAGNARAGGKQIKLSANHKRRMTQLYNQIKAGRKYDDVLTRDVYDFCERQNMISGKILYDLTIFS